jgi:hypothetical protein
LRAAAHLLGHERKHSADGKVPTLCNQTTVLEIRHNS